MSVWRIKDVDEEARKRAQAAADKAGMPLAAWVERAIMRRVNRTAPASQAGATARDATPPPEAAIAQDPSSAPPPASAADAAGAASDAQDVATPEISPEMQRALDAAERRRGKSKKRTRKKADPPVAEESLDTVEPDRPVAIQPPPDAAEAPFEMAAGNDAAPWPDAGPAGDAFQDPLPAVDPATIAATAADPVLDPPPTQDEAAIFAEPAETATITTTPREALLAHAMPRRQAATRRASALLPLGLGLIGVAAVGAAGYFLFLADGDDGDSVPPPRVASATPTPSPIAAPAAQPSPPAVTAPAPTAPSPVVAAPSPASAPVPMPVPAPQSATAPPPGIPAPTPGVQPSFLVGMPELTTTPGSTPATGMPPAGTPAPGGPLVAQNDTTPNLIKRAEAGDVDAQLELGKRYMQNPGGQPNPTEALRWLLKAAEAGNPQAQFNVGVMYERGIGTVIDPVKAVQWYRKAAEQPVPVPTAIHNLALLYINGGGGLTPNPAQARTLMTRAAELGQPESQYSLALMLFQGVGGPADRVAALSWLALAARTNNPQYVQAAQELLGALNADEKARAQQMANEHVTRINQNITRLHGLANGGAPTAPDKGGDGADKPLDRAGIVEIQKLLAGLKLYGGELDGATGPKTEQAIREYQKMAGLPVDGKATVEVLNSLRDVAGAVSPK